jgi:hypothetical protein
VSLAGAAKVSLALEGLPGTLGGARSASPIVTFQAASTCVRSSGKAVEFNQANSP